MRKIHEVKHFSSLMHYSSDIVNRVKFAIENPALAFRWLTKRGSDLTEIELTYIARKVLGKGAILEAGSSDGVDTVRLAMQFPAHQIYAIEPIVEQFEVTKAKTSNLENVKNFNFALSTNTGLAEMYVGKSGKGIEGMGSSSLLEPTRHTDEFPEITFNSKQPVNAVTLEDFCALHDVSFVDLLWLDVQGLELKLIKRSEDFLKKRVNLIHMEVSRVELYRGSALYSEVMSYMNKIGFAALKKRVGRISGNCLFQNQKL